MATGADIVSELLPGHCAFDEPVARESLAALPAAPAVFLLCDGAAAPILLARTQNLRRQLLSRLVEAPAAEASTKRANLADVTRAVRWRVVHSAFEARWRYLCVARVLYPRDYRRRLDFGPAYYLHVDWADPIPDITVSERIWTWAGDFAGPWRSRRDAAAALDGLRDLFDLCRYPEQVLRSPSGKRCAYADMGRCDAPCDGSVGLDAYVERVQAAWKFMCGGAGPWISDAELRMRAAAAAQQFEHAAQLKQQLVFARKWRADWSGMVGAAKDLAVVLLIPATRRAAWKPFLLRSGALLDGPLLRSARAADEAAAWFASMMGAESSGTHAELRMEQSWLVEQFCGSDAAASAVVIRFGRMDEGAKVAESVRAALRERRAARRSSAVEEGDEPTTSVNE